MKLTKVQETVIRYRIREAYDNRIKQLKDVRQNHVNRLIETNVEASNLARLGLSQRLIRDIDEQIKNHESMCELVLSSLGGKDAEN